MKADQQKIVQYLNEAAASEHALVRVLQSQIAMTPRGDFRSGLEKHLEETQDHARRVAERLQALGQGGNPLLAIVGAAESAIGQLLAATKTPFDLLRGSGGEEKVLKNAKDACATEALEIATYTSIKRLAGSAGDSQTERLADSILADEERMLKRLLREIPKLTDAVYRAEVKDDPSFDIAKTGAGENARAAGSTAKSTAKKASKAAKKSARKARRVPGVAQAEGQAKGALASAGDLAIARYDSLTADEVIAKLNSLSQIDLAKVDAYERKHDNRSTVLSRITSLRGDEPWPGYDELKASEVQAVLAEGDDERAASVRSYERTHKDRASVIAATERDLSNA